MSEPIRYDFIYNENYASVEREEHKEGDYVSYEDYARLKAEVERLRFAEDLLKDENQHLREEEPLPDGWNSAVAKACDILAEKDKENARLKAEVEELTIVINGFEKQLDREMDKSAMLCGQVERLIKIGDELAEELERIRDDTFLPKSELVVEWNAAKEGKQP